MILYGVLLPWFIRELLGLSLRLWSDASPYLAQIFLGAVAFIALLKDWRDYGRLSTRFGKYVPLGLATLTLMITALGIRDTEQARVDQGKSQQQIAQMSRQIAQLRQELTQPKPKPNLVATFPTQESSEVPIKETTLPRNAGVVTVQFSIYNSSDVAATNGSVLVRVCTLCKFAEEPPGFTKVAGADESDREHPFQHIYAKAMMEVFTLKVDVPANVGRAAIGVFATCETCLAAKQQQLWINVR